MEQPGPSGRQPGSTYLSHLAYFAGFALFAVIFTWPLAHGFTSAVIGGAGDNLSFVWNFWWARQAVAGHTSPFWTPALFAPAGTSLATHTFVPLFSIGAALLFPHTAPVTLYNGAVLLSVFLNFACAYAAAWTATGDRPASAFAAIAFGGAPFLGVRVDGHLSVLSAWGLPLLFLLSMAYLRRPTISRAVSVAAALGLIAYVDDYDFIYGGLMVALLLAMSHRRVSVSARPLTPVRKRWAWTIAVLLGAVLAGAALIALTGGTDTAVAGVRIRMTDTFNARVAAGFLIAAIAIVWAWPRIQVRRVEPAPHTFEPARGRRGQIAPALAAAAVLAVLLAPLAREAFIVWRAGDYSSQAYVWRNAPPGIDLATLFLGNQLHPLTRTWTLAAYRHFNINGVEGAAWLGIAPLLLVALAWRRRGDAIVHALFWIGGFFLVWALGPYLRIFNYNTGFMLPQTLLRYVPVAANARIPGRAFIVVQLIVALLGAMALSDFRRRSLHSAPLWTTLAIAVVLVDYAPAPHPTTPLDVPAVYQTLRGLPQGIVLNVPFGIRDGFGPHGAPDDRLLFYQTVHEHPQMGGFVARLSRRTEGGIESDPVLGPILALSEHGAPSGSITAPCRSSLACSARYLVFDRRDAAPDLQAFVDRAFSLTPVADDGTTTLFEVERLDACSCR